MIEQVSTGKMNGAPAGSMIVGAFGARLLARARAWLGLTKPRITALIVLTTAASFRLAAGPAQRGIGMTVLTTALLAAGIFALNQYFERDLDGRMSRTRDRALPSGRVAPGEAFAVGAGLCAAALGLMMSALPLVSAAVGLFTLVSYLLIYTPLKRVTIWHTTIGAVSGATPPLLGWAAAEGRLPADAWALAGILFLWQFPHFIAIETIYRDDYARAGFRVAPVVDPSGRLTRLHLLLPLVLLLPASVLPALTGLVRPLYVLPAIGLGVVFLALGWRARAGGAPARALLRASVLYLPLLFGLLLLLRF